MSGPGPGSGTEDELLRICMQGHRRAHTSFEDLFMREDIFIHVTDADGPELTDKSADSVSCLSARTRVLVGFFRPALIVLISVSDRK